MIVENSAIEIVLPTSGRFLEMAVYSALVQGREASIRGIDGDRIPSHLRKLSQIVGYNIEINDRDVELRKSSDPRNATTNSTLISKHNGLANLLILARHGVGMDSDLSDNLRRDYETELLMLRRFGFSLVERESTYAPVLSPPSHIKYTLPPKNYHILDLLILSVLATGCEVELHADHELDFSDWGVLTDIGVDISRVAQDEEEDELARRLRRARKAVAEEYCYTIRKIDIAENIDVVLPCDHLLGMFVAGLFILSGNGSVRLTRLPRTASVASISKALARMGVETAIQDDKSIDDYPASTMTVSPGELIGKRFGGGVIRSCPELLFLLGPLGMIADGKTVIRDLPFGSALWRERVGFVRETLEACGARIGEVEDGLVVEGGGDLMMMTYFETGDRLCDLMQSMLTLALPHHSSFRPPAESTTSAISRLYNRLVAAVA